MGDLLIGLAGLLLIVLANVIVKYGDVGWRRGFDLVLLLLQLPLLLIGLLFLLIRDDPRLAEQLPGIHAPVTAGAILVATAVWGMLSASYAGRAWLARLMKIAPGSAVHALALVLVGWVVGNFLLQATQIDLSQLVQSMGQIDVRLMVGQLLLFLLLSVLGVGLFIRRDGRETCQRLGLEMVSLRQLISGLKWLVVLIVAQAVLNIAWLALAPEQAETVVELNKGLQSDLTSVDKWLILALSAGIGEEILLRGALQPVLGVVATAVLFALLHVQYGLLSPAMIMVFVFGLLFGHIRAKHNTTLAILVHAAYNLIIGLIALSQA